MKIAIPELGMRIEKELQEAVHVLSRRECRGDSGRSVGETNIDRLYLFWHRHEYSLGDRMAREKKRDNC